MHRWLQLLGFYSVLWLPFIYLCVFVFWGTNMPSALWFLWSHILSKGLAGPFPGMLVKIPSFTTRPSAGQLYYLSGKLKVLSLWKLVVTSALFYINAFTQLLLPVGSLITFTSLEWGGEEVSQHIALLNEKRRKKDFAERQERLAKRQLRMPARDKDLGTHSKPIEVYGSISMGLGPELFREMNREIINGFGRETNPEVAEVDGTAVKKKVIWQEEEGLGSWKWR